MPQTLGEKDGEARIPLRAGGGEASTSTGEVPGSTQNVWVRLVGEGFLQQDVGTGMVCEGTESSPVFRGNLFFSKPLMGPLIVVAGRLVILRSLVQDPHVNEKSDSLSDLVLRGRLESFQVVFNRRREVAEKEVQIAPVLVKGGFPPDFRGPSGVFGSLVDHGKGIVECLGGVGELPEGGLQDALPVERADERGKCLFGGGERAKA
jgi:hypothetical protein